MLERERNLVQENLRLRRRLGEDLEDDHYE
jgi:hypothetical protein